ncbi:salutaridinol 7-O-acetyltransferase-like isoform X1 [Citrus sinensis]|uniref:salutaridinol 7-O-acetyltransferase-like isoform X1 n=1 Tax=Citrus sinensis TaxID=2711 RepID=UPI000CECFA06|nr:salutaridinol 7-O-acetyltransferase-like isoform X1 [Citrus sinensis]XP_024045193.1 salutaridinol 7-O-acetyltransferase-like isoform X1 [Citrus x clementina]
MTLGSGGSGVVADGNDQSGQIAGAHAAKVQVTSFACGGLVVCAGISHMIGDGTIFSPFVKSWAATARKTLEEAVCRLSFDASSLFPPRDAYPREATAKDQFARFRKTGRFVTRRSSV